MFLHYHFILCSMYHYRTFLELSKLKSRCFLPIAGKKERNLFSFFFKSEVSYPRSFLRRKQPAFRRFFVFAGMASTRGMPARILSRNAAAVPRVFLVGSTRLAAATSVNLILDSAKSNEKKGPQFVAPQPACRFNFDDKPSS